MEMLQHTTQAMRFTLNDYPLPKGRRLPGGTLLRKKRMRKKRVKYDGVQSRLLARADGVIRKVIEEGVMRKLFPSAFLSWTGY